MDPARLNICLVLLLTTAFGVAVGQLSVMGGDGRPLCSLDDLVPCINGAVESYVRQTEGEEAVKMALQNMEVMQKVAGALMTDITIPGTDLNQTCSVLLDIDLEAMVDCFEEVNTVCSLAPSDEILDSDVLVPPSLQQMNYNNLPQVARSFCNEACTVHYMVPQKVATMTGCWQQHAALINTALATVDIPNFEDCREIEDFALCQWNNSKGCEMVEELTRQYLEKLSPVFDRCNITLPEDALPASKITINSGVRVASTPMVVIVTWFTLLFTSNEYKCRPHGCRKRRREI